MAGRPRDSSLASQNSAFKTMCLSVFKNYCAFGPVIGVLSAWIYSVILTDVIRALLDGGAFVFIVGSILYFFAPTFAASVAISLVLSALVVAIKSLKTRYEWFYVSLAGIMLGLSIPFVLDIWDGHFDLTLMAAEEMNAVGLLVFVCFVIATSCWLLVRQDERSASRDAQP
ncbi:hypothetical protein [Microvirga solisilvae]|uniref:hypothetical protein n=1 Tax=Microvirga solisilvae TaxID=2919498 RepID=UPI001FAFE9CD|nr:hypothetical protein [Microvirga solisilvae]